MSADRGAADREAAGSYRRLLAVPVLRGLAVADVCARLPQGMVTVTLLLVAAAHASMTTAGLVVTGYTLGQAVTGPLRGRLADSRGLAVVCAACGGVYALALPGLLSGSLASGPGWLLVATAAVAGLGLGPSLATLFGLASTAVPGGGTETQSWLNSAMNGGAAAGAALAGATGGRPVLALACMAGAAAVAAGTATIAATGRRAGPECRPRMASWLHLAHWGRPLLLPRVL